MLAKLWKKILLFICIILCIYNVMHKLVSRTSLEVQLESVKTESSIINSRDKIDTNANTVSNNNYEKNTYLDINEKESNEKDKENIFVVIN